MHLNTDDVYDLSGEAACVQYWETIDELYWRDECTLEDSEKFKTLSGLFVINQDSNNAFCSENSISDQFKKEVAKCIVNSQHFNIVMIENEKGRDFDPLDLPMEVIVECCKLLIEQKRSLDEFILLGVFSSSYLLALKMFDPALAEKYQKFFKRLTVLSEKFNVTYSLSEQIKMFKELDIPDLQIVGA